MHAPLSAAYRVEWRSLAALDDIADEWHTLAHRALEPNVFYAPGFLGAAARVFGKEAGAALVWSGTGRLVGLFPARRRRGFGGLRPAWTGFVHPFAPLGTPLVDRAEPESAIAAWIDHLAHVAGTPALALLPLLPEQGAFAAALDMVLSRSGHRHATLDRHARALLAPGAQRDAYVERAVSPHRRKELRRLRRRLGEIAPVTFTMVAEPDAVRAALEDFLVIEASGWKGIAGTAVVNDPAIRDFVESAIEALAAERKVRIGRLHLNGRAIAAAVVLISGDSGWCWKIAHNEGLAQYSPGVQLMLDLTSALMTQDGLDRVDSCATAHHPMIDHIWRERLLVSDRLIALRPGAVPFALACAAEAARRRAIAAAKAVRNRMRGR